VGGLFGLLGFLLLVPLGLRLALALVLLRALVGRLVHRLHLARLVGGLGLGLRLRRLRRRRGRLRDGGPEGPHRERRRHHGRHDASHLHRSLLLLNSSFDRATFARRRQSPRSIRSSVLTGAPREEFTTLNAMADTRGGRAQLKACQCVFAAAPRAEKPAHGLNWRNYMPSM